MRTHAWFLLLIGFALIAVALPRLLGWPSEALIACLVLAIALMVGAGIAKRRAVKEAGSTGARDRAA